MINEPKISVCLASYNGQLFIKKQVKSILDQLKDNDELIIIDDCSTDKTVSTLNEIKDKRIKLFKNEINLGVNKTFEKSVQLSSGDYIFLSDQDDIWIPGRIDLMVKKMNDNNVDLISCNFVWINENDFQVHVDFDGVSTADSFNYLKNIFLIFKGTTNYYGCAMAFRKSLKKIIIPFPIFIESHDIFIALAANLKKSNVHIDAITLKKRIHSNNLTSTKSNRNLFYKSKSRIVFLYHCIVIIFRLLIKSKKSRNKKNTVL